MAGKTPALRRHKRSGNAYARFNGRQLWFGRYDDPKAHETFARTLAEWKANGFELPPEGAQEGLSLADLVARYLAFAEEHYCRPDGWPTREIEHLRDDLRPLLAIYASLPVNVLGIRELKVLRSHLIERGLARSTINDRINRIVRVVG